MPPKDDPEAFEDPKLFELQFSFKNSDTKQKPGDTFALIAADDAGEALKSLLEMWTPQAEIGNIQIRQVTKYTFVHLGKAN